MPYTDNGMRDLFLDKDGRIWFGTPPNIRVGYFYLASEQRHAATRRGCGASPRYAFTCRRARKPLLAGVPTSQGATRSHAAAARSPGAVLPAGPAASKAPSLPL